MDVLSSIFGKVKLSSVVYFKSDFSSPWGMRIQDGPFAQFHFVTRGQCLLNTGDEMHQLFAGDIVVFPLGSSHWLANSKTSELKNGNDVVTSIVNNNSVFTGDTVSATLICGHFEFDRTFDHPFISELPKVILITDAERKSFSWLKNITDLIVHETQNNSEGSSIIINKLGEILFIHIMRAYLHTNDSKKNFLAALKDSRMIKALKAIHATPEHPWQLASLAQLSGMSRTGFINQFKLLLGETPRIYLTNWRITCAKELLEMGELSVGEIAESVGYKSEAAFNRVFKKYTSQTPLKYRQALQIG